VKFQRQSKEAVDVNLTPLIDVVFLLLIFFMVSTTFTKETHLAIDLPEADGEKAVAQNVEFLEIVISSSGDFTVNEKTLVNNTIEVLKSAIEKASDSNNKLPMIITADGQTPHQAVVTAMDAAGQLGFVSLKITTQKPQQDN